MEIEPSASDALAEMVMLAGAVYEALLVGDVKLTDGAWFVATLVVKVRLLILKPSVTLYILITFWPPDKLTLVTVAVCQVCHPPVLGTENVAMVAPSISTRNDFPVAVAATRASIL